MSSKTKNLGLFKYDTTTDGKQVFSIDKGMNENWDIIDSNTLAHRHITNCILEAPKRVEFSIVAGESGTIKKGSVVIVPYGTTDLKSTYPVGSTFLHSNFKVKQTSWADNKFFVWAEVQQDITASGDTTDTNIRPCYIDVKYNTLRTIFNHRTGTADLTVTGNCMQYRTDQNKIQAYGGGALKDYVMSLPFAYVQADGTGSCFGKIIKEQIGVFFMGRTIFVDKDVKLAMGSTRTSTGHIQPRIITTSKISIKASHTYSEERILLYKQDTVLEDIASWRYLTGPKKDMPTTLKETSLYNYFCTDTLETYYSSGSKTANWLRAYDKAPIAVYDAVAEADGDRIVRFNGYTTFRAVDYNEFQHCVFKRDLSNVAAVLTSKYQNGTTWYRLYSDGWIEQGGQCTNAANAEVAITLPKAMKDTNYCVQGANISYYNNGRYACSPCCKKTSNSVITLGNIEDVQVIYSWYVCGYTK